MFGVVARRVEHRQDAEQAPGGAVVGGPGDAQGAIALAPQVFDDGFDSSLRKIC
ncbi:MAG: hypothetical protein U1F59_02275 [Candidatus Competibacteraceae bacterium]